MVTEYIFLVLKDNYKIFVILDSLRDVFLILIIIFSFGSLVIDFFNKKKLNKVYLVELVLVSFFVLVISLLLNQLFPSLRPLGYFSPFEEQKLDSFPSRHTALSFGITFITLSSNFQLGFLLFILSIWVALLSWLSLAHWPIDIIAGILISIVSAYLTYNLIQSFFRFYIKKTKA